MREAERPLLLTCEHGGNRIPREHRVLFRGREALLLSHRSWDSGALAVARSLARATGAPLVAATTTRLLVDANRSLHNPAVFSEVSRALPPELRRALLARYHRPYWERVRRELSRLRSGGAALTHVAVHSFTPVWRGARRSFDVGILYDPKRGLERTLAVGWQQRLRRAHPDLRVRRNAPYRGDADGLTTELRKEFPADAYIGLELELNQRWAATAAGRRRFVPAISTSLRAVLGDVARRSAT